MGKVSSYPEKVGVDFFWITGSGKRCGVQRKEFKDLLASIGDRLSREVAQMKVLNHAVLLVEGEPRWTLDGELMDFYVSMSKSAYNNLLLSVMDRGIKVIHTSGLNDTIRTIEGIERWTGKEKHRSLDNRAKRVGGWGISNNRDFGIWALQSLPGISHTLAANIYDYFGRVPWAWTCDEGELTKVAGIGKVKAKTIYRTLGEVEGLEKNGIVHGENTRKVTKKD